MAFLTFQEGYKEGYRLASKHPFKARSCWRIKWRIRGKVHQAYKKTEADADRLLARVILLEDASRSGIAQQSEILDWIERGWLSTDEAMVAFPGWKDTGARRRRTDDANFKEILDLYEQRALDESKAHDAGRKSHRNNMGQTRQIVEWLSMEHPDLRDLTEDHVRGKLRQLESSNYSPWTVMHWLTKTRILIDCAVKLGMIEENPSRSIRLRQPKRVAPRVIIEPDEAVHLLERSLHYRQWINGGLPTACRLGLYAGLRPEEMAWCQWGWLSSTRHRLDIQETVCEETGKRWIPKDWEMRVIGVKAALVEFVAAQKEWLKRKDFFGPFMLPGGGARRSGFKNRHLSENAIQSAFRKMVIAEGLNPKITLYSFRHTFLTELARAGVDVRTLQEIAGHSEIRTTEGYLHALRAEKQTDGLPY